MNTGGEAAEQIVRMSLEGFEVAAKITGAGAKNIAILLYSILKEEKKTKGKGQFPVLLAHSVLTAPHGSPARWAAFPYSCPADSSGTRLPYSGQ